MKSLIKPMIILLFAVIMMINMPEVCAEETVPEQEYSEEIQSQVDGMLEEYDISFRYSDMEGLSLDGIISGIKESVSERINGPIMTLGIILVIIIFTSFVQGVGENALIQNSSLNMYKLVSVLASAAVITPRLLSVYQNASSALDRGGGFMLVFVPVFAGISIFSGGLTSVGVYNAVTLGAAEIMVQVSSEILMPILIMNIALSICGSIFGNNSIESLVQTIRKIMIWTMTVAVTLFSGFVSLKCTLGGAVDGFAVKTVKYMVSGFVPIIGGAISDAYSTVKGSFDVMRCTAGTAGTIGIVMLMLPPILELMAYRGMLWIAKAASGMFSVTALDKLFKNLDAGLSICVSMLVSFSVLFIISTAILMKTMG